MIRKLLSPGWIVTHLVVIAIAVLFINLGLWQLDRHDERQAEIARTEAMLAAPPVALEDALTADDVVHRATRATGVYLADAQLQLSPRSNADRPGFEVLTPMRLEDGRVLMVNRGWMPLDSPLPEPPEGDVTVEGRLAGPGVARQVLPPGGEVAELVSNVDLELLRGQVDGLITTAYLARVDDAALSDGSLPRPAGPVSLDSGNHMSYAVQWFAFTAVGLIGYPLLLRRRLQDDAAADAATGPPPEPRPSERIETTRASQ